MYTQFEIIDRIGYLTLDRADKKNALNFESWFTSAGVRFEPKVPYLMVDTLAVALEMALNGEGVALVNGPFVDQDLAAGRLVRPSSHVEICPGAWGLICRKDMKENLRIRTFMNWMADHVTQAAAIPG